MSVGVRAIWGNELEIAAGSIGANFVAIPGMIEEPARYINFLNNTDVDLKFSDNGTDDKFTIPPKTMKTVDVSTNRDNLTKALSVTKRQKYYVRHMGESPTAGGAVYIDYIYGTK